MKQWKKYLSAAILIIGLVCILFSITIKRHKKISEDAGVKGILQKKEMPAPVKNRQEKVYHGEDIKDQKEKAKARNEKLLLALKTADMEKSVKERIMDYIANIPESVKDQNGDYKAETDFNRKIDNTGNKAASKPHTDQFSKDYNIPPVQRRSLIESFRTVHDPGNEQEIEYRSSRLMDMGTTMLLNKDYKSAEDAFVSVIQMNSDDCSDISKWAKAGLIRSLEGQGRNDEAMDKKNMVLKICNKDEKFVSFLKR